VAHIEKRPNRPAPYRVRYRGPDGKERSRSFVKRSDAEKFAATTESDKARGTWIDPALGKTTLEAWTTRWMATRGDLKPKTRDGYESLLRTHVLPRLGRYPLGEVDPMDVREWVTTMQDAGLSPSRVRQAYRVLSGAMRAALEAGFIGRSPCVGVRLPRSQSREMHFLDARQVDQLAAEVPERYRALVYVLAYGGIRWGEAAALRRMRCDLVRGRLHITESVAEVGARMYYGPTKTYQSRVVTLPSFLRVMLSEHIDRHAQDGGDGFVFTAPKGGPLRRSDFWADVWRPAVSEATVPDGLRIHDLRHTCVALLIAQGAHAKMIQTHLGHASVMVTMDRYGHLFPDDMDRLAATLDAVYQAAQERSKPSLTLVTT
jgi:integrase